MEDGTDLAPPNIYENEKKKKTMADESSVVTSLPDNVPAPTMKDTNGVAVTWMEKPQVSFLSKYQKTIYENLGVYY